MVEFVYNSACVPLSSKDTAIRTADEVFHALLRYVGEHTVPMLISDRAINQLYITEKFSILDFVNMQQKSNRDFFEVLLNLTNRVCCIPANANSALYEYSVKVGDDTRFKNNLALKYACKNNDVSCPIVLMSISDESYWLRDYLECILYNSEYVKSRLYNLYSTDISYLPVELPPFSLSDTSRFEKTNFHRNKAIIYRESKTGYYWYNDYFHRNNKAHFEVFDAQGYHIGEASMKGELDRGKADKNKCIKDLIN